MSDQLIDSEDLADTRGRELAQQAIEALDLIVFIRSWNTADAYASLIASFDHLYSALYFHAESDHQYDHIARQAKSEGCELDFLAWMSILLTPTISTTFVQSLVMKSQEWSRGVFAQDPVAFDAPVPFPDADALIGWILATIERPPIAGPTGETILDDDAEEHLLRQALRAEVSTALGGGWLKQPAVRRSVGASKARRSGTPGSRS